MGLSLSQRPTTNLRIADEIKITRIARSEQLNILESRESAIKNQIKDDLEQCSGQLLAPLLSNIHASLPLGVRESIYENVFDTSKPIVIPRMEDTNTKFMNTGIQSGSAGAGEHMKAMHEELNPFMQDYCFSTAVMGSQTSTEIKNLVLRKTPFYFRGSRRVLNVRHLLDTEIRPGGYTFAILSAIYVSTFAAMPPFTKPKTLQRV
ncbi:hypothetical protein BKA58DRAFT_182322 [Alternaria rosae]|uniref:uncharacterized protein n=1 Tax=Alternaria rosae TaxID=1187941 RepID=UPI001E8D406D|nr:uncharacterized protein BKA58DRAFT_182322 [Alternaria rosae]KAH6870716.1 hypothetical protein BKA58DRAFT_182322 [Alternaria rosae]